MSLIFTSGQFGESQTSRKAKLFEVAWTEQKDVYFNVKRDMERIAEPVLIRTFNNPVEIVRICERESVKVVQVLRNGVDEIYVMDYASYDSFLRFYKKI